MKKIYYTFASQKIFKWFYTKIVWPLFNGFPLMDPLKAKDSTRSLVRIEGKIWKRTRYNKSPN